MEHIQQLSTVICWIWDRGLSFTSRIRSFWLIKLISQRLGKIRSPSSPKEKLWIQFTIYSVLHSIAWGCSRLHSCGEKEWVIYGVALQSVQARNRDMHIETIEWINGHIELTHWYTEWTSVMSYHHIRGNTFRLTPPAPYMCCSPILIARTVVESITDNFPRVKKYNISPTKHNNNKHDTCCRAS